MRHGHVTPNADGSRARCGGPAFCKDCQSELAEKSMREQWPALTSDSAGDNGMTNEQVKENAFPLIPPHGMEKLGGLKSFLAGFRGSDSCKRNEMEAQVDDWMAGIGDAYALAQSITEIPQEYARAMDLLNVMFDRWENGVPCYDDISPVGNALSLSNEEFHEIVDLLRKHRPNEADKAASLGGQP